MIRINDRVRHKDAEQFKHYGIMQVIEIKGGHAVCQYGGFYNLDILTVPLADLIKE